jgi:hypothetical protein
MVDALHMVPPFKIGVALCDAQRYQEAASAGFYFTNRPSAKKDS